MRLLYVFLLLLIATPFITSCEADSLEEEQLIAPKAGADAFENFKHTTEPNYHHRDGDTIDDSETQREPDTGDQGNPIDEGHDDD